jgi:hypothetical protein
MTVIINAGSTVTVRNSSSSIAAPHGASVAGGPRGGTATIIAPTLSPTIVAADVNQPGMLASGAEAAACFAAGTRIRAARGEVSIERLAIGDHVLARFAGATPVVWIGHRHIDCRRHPAPSLVLPVRISAHAFAPRMPERDLVLSPDHAVFVDDVLVPVRHLINDQTIRRENAEAVLYYHVELAEHDLLLAEGLAAESYLDAGDRHAFDNGGAARPLPPASGRERMEALRCAPLVVAGEQLTAIRLRLSRRAPRTPRADRQRRQIGDSGRMRDA